MAYIEPNTDLVLCENVPLDPTYEHTWWFPADNTGPGIQYAKVAGYSRTGLQFTRQSYQRKDRGVIKVESPIENLIYCNYMAFKNSAFENKWFYAFIPKVEYINNITTAVYYSIDVLMTWYFDYTFDTCWIDRQHSTTDVAGDNLIEEGLETGEYIFASAERWPSLDNPKILVATTYLQDGSYSPANGKYWGKIFSGCDIRDYDANNLISFLSDITRDAKSDGIISIYMCPSLFWSQTGSDGSGLSGDSKSVNRPTAIDGYTPRNKKLFTYPYCFSYVSNDSGNGAVFPFEYFTNKTRADFTIKGTCMPPVSGIIYPNNYKGVLSNEDEKITISGYPLCSFSIDAFRAWLAQNTGALVAQGAPLVVDAVGAAINGIRAGVRTAAVDAAIGGATGGVGLIPMTALETVSGGSITANPLRAGLNAFNNSLSDDWFQNALGMLGSIRDHYVKPPQAGGTLAGSVEFGAGIKNFLISSKTIRAQFARIIDSFFDKYGYAQHTLARPNVQARPCWTYIKTAGCTINGSVPADDTKIIEAIHDKGITYWRHNVNFLDYSQNNQV